MKVALVYDRVNKLGGAERVLTALHEIYPQAPLFTAVYQEESASWAKDFQIKTTFLQNLPFARDHHELYPWLTPLAFESLKFNDYDVVISVTSADAKGIITHPGTLHICYCLTPTRYLWSGYRLYRHLPTFGIWDDILKPCFRFLAPSLRRWDYIASSRPDYMIAISDTVKRRTQKYYRRDSLVIYPPVTVEEMKLVPGNHIKQDYFLSVGRLVPYKRFDIIVEAFTKLRIPLKVIGTGSQLPRLKRLAGPNVEFLGRVAEEKLLSYYRNCRAFVYAADEDFGIAAVEAQASGKPVICYGHGGLTEIVKEGITGAYFPVQSVESLVTELKRFDEKRYNEIICQENATRFSKKVFQKAFKSQVLSWYQQFRQNL